MARQIVIYTNNGTLFNLKKKLSTDACYNLNQPQKHGKCKSDTNITYYMIPFI